MCNNAAIRMFQRPKFSMNKALLNSTLALVLTVISSQSFSETSAPAAPAAVTDEEVAYFFGYRFGEALIQGGNGEVDLEVVMKGMQDSLERAVPTIEQNRVSAIIAEIQSRQEAVQAERIVQLQELSKSFLAENGNQEGIQQTESGLQYLVVEAGTGKSPTAADRVTVHYEGRLINDQVFDSSIQRGEPVTFELNRVIPGWTEGLQLMKEGGTMRFFIPSELGYGPGGTQNIPPYAVLVFDVQLIEVLAAEPAVESNS